MASLLGLPPSFSGFVLENEPMSRHTTYRIGGPVRAYVRADSLRSLVDVIDAVGWGQADAGIPDMDPCAGEAAVVAPCARDRSSRMKGIVS